MPYRQFDKQYQPAVKKIMLLVGRGRPEKSAIEHAREAIRIMKQLGISPVAEDVSPKQAERAMGKASYASKSYAKKGTPKASSWIDHVKKYAYENEVSYKDAMSLARPSYNKLAWAKDRAKFDA